MNADSASASSDYEAVIGLEVHVQLSTQSKLFCGCSHDFGAQPNDNTCPVCLGHPGALPAVNREALRLGVRAAVSFGCEVASFTKFDRKNYFYPDLPKGYQISQSDFPYATGGAVAFEREDGTLGRVELERIHVEEDAGKLMHEEHRTLVDLNRCGTPLLEIVSLPQLRAPRDAYLYLRTIRDQMRWIRVSDANMEEGSLRCDVNVSLRPRGQVEFGTRAEVKNLNSFTNVEAALVYEIERQEGVLRSGGTVKQETRLFDAERGETRSMRGKEDAHDYRYFPEPDLPTITISRDWVEQERAQLPELPVAMRQRLRETLGLSAYDAGILTSQRSHAEYFEQLVATGLDPKDASNWFQSDILRELNERRIQLHEIPLQPEQIAVIVRAVATDRVSVATGREVLKEALAGEADPAALLAARGEQVSDTTELLAWVDAVIEANADTVAKIRAGNDKAIAFLMGQVMKESGGKANPRVVSKMIHERLQE